MESKIKYYLIEEYIIVETQKTFDWSIFNGHHLRFDFFIPYLNILIEYDGEQHFNQISSWNLQEIQIRDNYKNNMANKNGYNIIRINYIEIYTTQWKDKLKFDKNK